MSLIKEEFYYSKEYNSTTEYKTITAEAYTVSKEIADIGEEIAKSGEEITTTSKKTVTKKKDSQSFVKSLLNSIKGVAVTATVAVAAVVGVTTVAPSPKVDLLELNAGGTYVEYVISVAEMQSDLQYYLVISTSNEDDIRFLVESEGVYNNKAEGLKPEWEYSLSFVSYDETWGERVYFEKTFQTTEKTNDYPEEELPEIPQYAVGISKVTAIALNEVRIDFWSENLEDDCTVELQIDYGNPNDNTTVMVTKRDLERGYVTLSILETATSFTVQPILKYGENQEEMQFTAFESDLSNCFEVDVKVNTSTNQVLLFLKGSTANASYVEISGSSNLQEYVRQEISIDYDSMLDLLEYTIVLTDAMGEKLTNEVNLTINISPQQVDSYVFNYKNPGDVGVTYNEDGTINVYIKTDFESADEKIYYEVQLGNKRFISRESIFVAEALPDDIYALTYRICYDYNGVQYYVNEIVPSGVVNEFYTGYMPNYELVGNTFTITVYDYALPMVDLDSFRIETSSGEEIQLLQKDFVYDAENGVYNLSVELINDFEYLNVYLDYHPFINNMEGIENYVGTTAIKIADTIYKN
ncbi:MAG: hypothetical protein E7339_00450 [Clostridiales bacterium]|nr:hypothetical protein [Clostridiales bacterium]